MSEPSQNVALLAKAAIPQYRFVRLSKDADREVEAAANAAEPILGVTQNATTAAGQAQSVYRGRLPVKVEASAAINDGDFVTGTTAGKAVATTTAEDYIGGQAISSAGADGDIFEIIPMDGHVPTA